MKYEDPFFMLNKRVVLNSIEYILLLLIFMSFSDLIMAEGVQETSLATADLSEIDRQLNNP